MPIVTIIKPLNKIFMKIRFLLLTILSCVVYLSHGQTNLVIGGGFENTINPCDYKAEINTIAQPPGDFAQSSIIQHVPASNEMRRYRFCTPDFYSNLGWNCTFGTIDLPLPHDDPNENLNYFGLMYHKNGTEYISQEFAFLELSETLEVNNQYTLSFWARINELNGCDAITVNIVGDDIAPCINGGITLLDGTVSACGYTANILDSSLPIDIIGDWKKYTIPLNNLPDNINNLIIFPTIESDDGVSSSLVLLDDFEIYQKEDSSAGSDDCINENGSFETTTSCASNPFAFNNSCVPNWISVHGSPDLCTSSCLGISPPIDGGNNYAAIGSLHTGNSNGCRNEALFMPLDLIPGNSYIFSFYHRTVGVYGELPIEVNVLQSSMPNGIVSSGVSPCSDLEIPANHQVLLSNTSFTSDNWIKETFCFKALDIDEGGLVFFTGQNNDGELNDHLWLIDMVCISEPEVCEPFVDLTSCPAEGDFGYIVYNCPGEYFWEFDGQGANGVILNTSENSMLLEATPGTYTVTFQGENGCEEVEQTWVIQERCCEKPCEIPTGLYCENEPGQVTLNWNNIPSAFGYEITIIPTDGDCGCKFNIPPPDPIIIPVTTNSYSFVPEYECFSWSVKTICGDGVESQSSESICFSSKLQDCFDLLEGIGNPDLRSNSQDKNSGKVNVYPNPSMKDVFISYQLEELSDVRVEIYDLQGTKVEEFVRLDQQGEDTIWWKPKSSNMAGSYFIKVTTRNWSSTERIILTK